jgi:hypothetical protein
MAVRVPAAGAAGRRPDEHDMLFEQIPAYLEYFGLKTTTAEVLRSVARLA